MYALRCVTAGGVTAARVDGDCSTYLSRSRVGGGENDRLSVSHALRSSRSSSRRHSHRRRTDRHRSTLGLCLSGLKHHIAHEIP